MLREFKTLSTSKNVEFTNGTLLSLRGANGRATQWVHSGRGFRLPAEEDTNPYMESALREIGIVTQETIHLDLTEVAPSTKVRNGDTVVLQPALPAGDMKMVQVVMYSDESGGVTWHFPDGFLSSIPVKNAKRVSKLRTSARSTFTIPTRTAKAERAAVPPPLRAIVTKVGRKVFKVFVVPIVAAILKHPVSWFAEKVESKYKQDWIRVVTPENYRSPLSKPFNAWRQLKGQRSLLIIHGIFSSTEGMLSLLPQSAMERLYRRYEGRVIAYDHLTVTKHPEENARFFLTEVKKQSGKFEFDVLTHSRGGIVTRTLTERGHDLLPGHNCDFRKVYMVAVPNQGSPLGNPRHMLDMIDVFTNVLTSFPDGWVTYSIEIILGIVKLMAYTGQTALPGIAAMDANGYIKETLNANPKHCAVEYAATAANYRPDPSKDNGFLLGPFANGVMDRVFTYGGKPMANDLVVPCDGVYEQNGHSSFPIRNCRIYSEADHVWHSGFFTRPDMLDHLNRHLGVDKQRIDVDVDRGGTSKKPKLEDSLGLRRFRPDYDTLPKKTPIRTKGEEETKKPLEPDRSKPPRPKGERLTRDTTIYRRPQIAFKEKVRVGTKEELIARLQDVSGNKTSVEKIIELLLEKGKSEIRLTVKLSAPGFKTDRSSAELVIKCKRDATTEAAIFQLTALNLGNSPETRLIRADFWLGNQCVGTVTHRTVIVPKNFRRHAKGDGRETFEMLTVTGEPRMDPDLVIYVQSIDTAGEPPFLLQMRSRLPERLYEVKQVGRLTIKGADLANYLNQIYSTQFATYPQSELFSSTKLLNKALQEWQQNFIAHLRAVGEKLWKLLPIQFHHEYFALMDLKQRPRSILVHSDEMILPWELMIPHRENGKTKRLPPLGHTHILGRWKPGVTSKPVPQQLPVKKFCVVNPVYKGANALPWAQEEVEQLRELFPNVSVVSPANSSNVEKRVFSRKDIQFLHYCGHGEYDQANSDLNHWILADGSKLDALLVSHSRLMRDGKPIVYMNACSVGQTGMVIGRMGGFAANLLDNGCSGVIAPYWPVNDRHAMEFSRALYTHLQTGRSIGEALQTLRLENPDNPTYQAFSYFGDPWALVQF